MALYDKVEWHLESVLAAGQPPEHAASHTGLYIGWCARRGLLNGALIDHAELEAVLHGELPGSALLEDFDQKLTSDSFTPEGDRFSAACYSAYLDAYQSAFADSPDWSVADDAASREIVEPILDRQWSDWVAAGRPSPIADPATRPESIPSTSVAFIQPGLPPDL